MKTTLTTRTACLVTVVAFASVSSVCAMAEQPEASSTSSAKVSLADLDLATAKGARTAHQRLHAAAQLACSRVADRLDLGRQQHFAECVDAAMALALPQVEELIRKRPLAYSVARD
jgi:UrcA family protein